MRPLLILLFGLLAACGDRNEPGRDIRMAVEECEDLGYERGTSDFVRCAQKIVEQERLRRDATLERHLARR